MSNESKFKIEQNVPIPNFNEFREGFMEIPLEDMQSGDSIFLPCSDKKKGKAMIINFSTKRKAFETKHPERKLVTRQMEGGLRIWRVR